MNNIFFGFLLTVMICFNAKSSTEWPKQLTDISGNTVTLQQAPQRIILASGFDFLSLMFIEPDFVSRLVGWGTEFKRFDTETYTVFNKRYPQLAKIQEIGSGRGDELSAEMLLSLQPDLVIFSLWQAASSSLLTERLQRAGINVIYIDFYQSPLDNAVPSMRLLGQVLDREKQTELLIDDYQSRLARLTTRLNKSNSHPYRVLLHAFPGAWDCCWASGDHGIGQFITLFNGINIGASSYPNSNGGQLSLEYIISANPEIYIATGHSAVNKKQALPLGEGIDPALSRQQLQKITSQIGLNSISAVKNKRSHGLWNYFPGSPLNIVAIELMAKWIQPALYQDINPQQTFDEITSKYLPVSLTGTYWVSATDAK